MRILISFLLGTSALTGMTQADCDSTFFVAFGFSTNGNVVNLQATSGGQASGYLWDFGDGTAGGGQAVDHVYAPGGPYQVCVQGWYWNGGDSCWSAPACQLVGPFNDPCDGLDASFTMSISGTTVALNALDLDDPVGYLWDFGDGNSGTGPDIVHQYPGATLFQACLTVWAWDPVAQDSCFATSCELIDLIGAGNDCDSAFFVAFGSSTTGNMVSFQATSGGQANGYLWDFGDGTSGGGQAVDHVYPPGGPYQVCLQGWYWNGVDTCWSATACQWLGPFNTPCGGVDAGFNIDVSGITVVFSAQDLDNPAGYLWEFGDGDTGAGAIVTHQYPGATLFQACLTVWAWDPVAQDPCFATSCQLIDLATAGNDCDSTFSVTMDWQANGPTVVLFGTANQPVDGWLWELGDGNESYTSVVTHLYEPPGPFEVCLSAWYWNGTDSCWAQTCQNLDPFSLGVTDQEHLTRFTVHPNPAVDHVLVHLSIMEHSKAELQLLSSDGRLVRSERPLGPLHRMDLGGLNAGPYLLVAILDEGIQQERIIIQ
jgi:PKD repeat protein